MPTAQAQQLTDIATVLADPSGPSALVVIGAATLRVIRDLPALLPADAEGVVVERQTLYGLRAELGFAPVPGMELVVDGSRWMVESCPAGDVLILTLARYRT